MKSTSLQGLVLAILGSMITNTEQMTRGMSSLTKKEKSMIKILEQRGTLSKMISEQQEDLLVPK